MSPSVSSAGGAGGSSDDEVEGRCRTDGRGMGHLLSAKVLCCWGCLQVTLHTLAHGITAVSYDKLLDSTSTRIITHQHSLFHTNTHYFTPPPMSSITQEDGNITYDSIQDSVHYQPSFAWAIMRAADILVVGAMEFRGYAVSSTFQVGGCGWVGVAGGGGVHG